MVAVASADKRSRLMSLARLAVAFLCLGAAVLAMACTRFGAGIGGDGVAYVAGARNILQGLGFSWVGPQGDVRPITIFAPLFSVTLSSLGLLGLDPLEGARWLNAALFGVNVALCARVLYRATRDLWAPLLGAVLVIFSPVILSAHGGALSEPMFIAFLLGAMILLNRYLESGRRSWLVLAAAAAGLSYLVRYVGLTVLGGGAALLLLSRPQDRRRKWVDLLIYLAVGAVIVAPWFLRNQLAGGSATARVVSLLIPRTDFFRTLADLVTYWFIPERLSLVWRLATLAAVGLFFAAAALASCGVPERPGEESGDEIRWARILGVHLLVYSGGVFGARLLLLPRISVDERMLLPVLLMVLLLMLLAVSAFRRRLGGRNPFSAVTVGVVFLLTLSYIGRGTLRAVILEGDGQGLASRRWRESPLMNALSILPPRTPIYTNEVEALYLLGGRSAYRLPTGCLPEDAMVVYEPGTECRTEEYQAWAAAMRRALEREMAVVALFDSFYEQPYYAPVGEELVAGLDVLTTQGDGRLFVSDRSQWPESPHW